MSQEERDQLIRYAARAKQRGHEDIGVEDDAVGRGRWGGIRHGSHE